MHYRADIQIMRGIAVLVVVLFHLGFTVFKNGFLGVDIFFVISGFLMAVLYKRGEVSQFYERRARRLLPAYFATIATTLLVSSLLVLSIDHKQVVDQSIWATFFSANLGFWNQDSYFSSKYLNPLLHLWSLGVEIQFYILVPFLFWVFFRNAKILIVVMLLSLVLSFVVLTVNAKTAFFITPFRIWQFLIGGGVALYLTDNGAVRSNKSFLGFLALIGIASLVLFYPIDPRAENVIYGHPGVVALVTTALTGIILAFGLPAFFVENVVGRSVAKLGDWSYSIYLAHFPVIVFCLYVPLSGTTLKPASIANMMLISCLVIVFSFLLYWFFDKRRWTVNIKTSVVSIVVLVALSFASLEFSKIKHTDLEVNIMSSYDDRDEFRCGRFSRIMDEVHVSKYFACEVTAGVEDAVESVLLLGDSTADAIKSSLAREAERNNYRLYITASNRIASGYVDIERIVSEAKALGITSIILHFHSPYIEGVIERGMYERLVESGFSVVWIAPVPYFDEPVPKLVYGLKETRDFFFSPVNEIETKSVLDNIRNLGAKVFEPWSVLCGLEGCAIGNEKGNSYYHDSLHMSLTGARQLEPLFSELFDFLNESK